MLITHQETGKGAQAADKHNISLRKTIDNAAGTLLPYTVSLTMTQARDVAVTNAMMLDSLRQIIDLVVTTAPITMDSTTVYSLLRGEA